MSSHLEGYQPHHLFAAKTFFEPFSLEEVFRLFPCACKKYELSLSYREKLRNNKNDEWFANLSDRYLLEAYEEVKVYHNDEYVRQLIYTKKRNDIQLALLALTIVALVAGSIAVLIVFRA